VTNPPQFIPQKHTAPFLVAATAAPNVGTVKVVDTQDPQALAHVTFAADVISQDDPPDSTGQFQEVHSRLFIDYGVEIAVGMPFHYAIPGTRLAAGTLDQTTGRRVSATWSPMADAVLPGCHTATLMASHLFDEQSMCPVCADDFSMISWQILFCDSSQGTCNALPIMGPGQCQAITTSCAAVESKSDAGSSCPDLVDGGAM
jgi:hypothetical protein